MHLDVDAARDLAAKNFTLGSERWLHAQTTARRAEQIAPVVGPIDRDLLLGAAWLHDVGYHSPAVRSGFHPLAGAVMLQEAGWPQRLVALVAHHGEARFAARALGLDAELGAFRREEGPLTDALVYADLAAAPDGRRMSLHERLDGLARRHADDPPALREAWSLRRAALIQAAARTEQRMAGLRHARTAV